MGDSEPSEAPIKIERWKRPRADMRVRKSQMRQYRSTRNAPGEPLPATRPGTAFAGSAGLNRADVDALQAMSHALQKG